MQSSATRDWADATRELVKGQTATGQESQSLAAASPTYPQEATQLVSYGDKKTSVKPYSKRKKPQDLNTRPINVRTNIMIANKNG